MTKKNSESEPPAKKNQREDSSATEPSPPAEETPKEDTSATESSPPVEETPKEDTSATESSPPAEETPKESNSATESSPPVEEVQDKITSVGADLIRVNELKITSPPEAPISEPEPLTGKQKAGVKLTWGIIAALSLFLFILLVIYFWIEIDYLKKLDKLTDLATGNSTESLDTFKELISAQKLSLDSFRTSWHDALQVIILNVFFPTLTALLGYVFGTSRISSSTEDSSTEDNT